MTNGGHPQAVQSFISILIHYPHLVSLSKKTNLLAILLELLSLSSIIVNQQYHLLNGYCVPGIVLSAFSFPDAFKTCENPFSERLYYYPHFTKDKKIKVVICFIPGII